MMVTGLQKPYDKMKVGQSCTCTMFIDSVDGCWQQDQNTWNTFLGSEYRTIIEIVAELKITEAKCLV